MVQVQVIARALVAAGALALALAVAAGAWSAHAARAAAHPEAPRLLQTAVLYALVHGLGLLVLGAFAHQRPSAWLGAAGALHLAGIILFCGSLFWLARKGQSAGIAPIGGMAFIAGWLCVAVYALRG
jgi:uncharacterized membrane protein YgdD (TMEM256/DUF423 family)